MRLKCIHNKILNYIHIRSTIYGREHTNNNKNKNKYIIDFNYIKEEKRYAFRYVLYMFETLYICFKCNIEHEEKNLILSFDNMLNGNIVCVCDGIYKPQIESAFNCDKLLEYFERESD